MEKGETEQRERMIENLFSSFSPFTLALLIDSAMPGKKPKSVSQLEALRGVRKALPPPTRTKEDEKKYRRSASRRKVREEVERAGEEG